MVLIWSRMFDNPDLRFEEENNKKTSASYTLKVKKIIAVT